MHHIRHQDYTYFIADKQGENNHLHGRNRLCVSVSGVWNSFKKVVGVITINVQCKYCVL
uniref:Uncharacterized protein n=1 Tax=Arion vulgaris TaxID=1028688 RepID=A0A0B7BTM2_9EUPU